MAKFSRGIVISLMCHMFLGASNMYQTTALNILKVFIVPFANQSFFDHYGVALGPSGYSWLWSSLQACQMVGMMASSLLLTPLMDMYGRRTTVMIFANGILLVGLFCQMMAKPLNSFELFGIGQVLGGIACGSVKVIFQLFAESTPVQFRGTVSLLYSFSLAAWSLIGIVFGFPFMFGTVEKWPYFFMPSVLPCILYVFAAYYVPESPKFLYLQKGERYNAIKSIMYYHGPDADVVKLLHHYDGEVVDENDRNKRTIGYRHLWRNFVYRKALFICLAANVCISWQLTTALIQYSNSIGQEFGLSNSESLTVILIIAIYYVACRFLVAVYGINRFGRVHILIASSLCTALAVLVIAFETFLKQAGALSHGMAIIIIFIWAFLLFSADGMSADGITTLLIGEIAPNVAAGKILQVCIFVSQGVGVLTVLTLPPLLAAFGVTVLIFYASLSVISAIVFYKIVPETKGTNVEDIIRKISIRYVGQLSRPSQEDDEDEAAPLLSSKEYKNRKKSTYV